MRHRCKCHGVSGSCSAKICWRDMAPFRQIGKVLKERFDGATLVKFDRRLNKFERVDKSLKEPSKRDLIYLIDSPTFCEPDKGWGSVGTTGRVCNKNSPGLDGCSLLCCGRGFNKYEKHVTEDCDCLTLLKVPPWLVLIRSEKNQCTGMLIQQDIVLSSASCIADDYGYINETSLIVMSGRRYANLLDEPYEQRRKSESIQLLSNYGLSLVITDKGDNEFSVTKIGKDIAVLFMEEEFFKSDKVYHKHSWEIKRGDSDCRLIGWNPRSGLSFIMSLFVFVICLTITLLSLFIIMPFLILHNFRLLLELDRAGYQTSSDRSSGNQLSVIRSSASSKNNMQLLPLKSFAKPSIDSRRSPSLDEDSKRQHIINILSIQIVDKYSKRRIWLSYIPKRIENACQRTKGNRVYKQDFKQVQHYMETVSVYSLKSGEFPIEDMMLLLQGMDIEDCPVEGLKMHKGSICLYSDSEPFSCELPSHILSFYNNLSQQQGQNLPSISSNVLWSAIN
ncbi:DgyrCDS7350 [Dimorphilus gyrociliatus]|uniref:Protein Wnt n=1 Tax=Dimorphilus gyrociliatus TaxID=2664684 RepID=A0A7I8VRQ8_9ANNE|nr:DgyrCDS7350 [Dimorphilus gyrociliatus]